MLDSTWNNPALGWVAPSCAARWRGMAGVYRWDEWPAFVDRYGLTVIEAHLPAWLPAAHVGRLIFVRRWLPTQQLARWVWHEIGHIVMHPGSCWFWDTLPWGALVLAKQERQAEAFAATFPVWGED